MIKITIILATILLASVANATPPAKSAKCTVETITRANPKTGKSEQVQALVCPKAPRVFTIGK